MEEEAAEYFECPQCGSSVENAATSCPKCGVLFAEEGADMFQCPACNTLVSVDAQSCPGCGAMFVEAEEAPEAEPEAPAPAPSPPPKKPAIEEPVAEVKPTPEEEKPAPEPEKKGLFGRLKWKKETPEPVVEKPAVKEAPPKPAPPPKKAPEVQIREAEPAKPTVAAPPTSAAAPAPAPRRPPPAPTPSGPVVKDKGRDLARMVAEMKPLLALAREKEVDIGESKTLIDDAAVAGRERQIDKAIELVQNARTILLTKIDSHLAGLITRLNDEIKVAREFGGDISRATTYIQEVARARSSGDVEAAYVYIDKIEKEMQPITGRYNDSRKKITSLKQFIADCEIFIVDTREARKLLLEANRAFEAKDFDKVDSVVKTANESLYKNIPARMNEEMKKAKDELLEAKVRNVNITPMLTVLKSATNLMKSGDYGQAIKEMREFKDMLKKP
ncbi:MAG: zinc ribbon domain-containing protein [Thermoplasmata archaeon]|nr:zinc ribbon domain-containing protein [Thermoplasmata archaeon]